MKKILAIILALTIILSMSVAVYAVDDPRPEVVTPITEEI